jgi:phosphoribosylanthranilate isomerase
VIRTRVKICGITRAEDARRAADLGAWALGFVFHPASRRAVSAAQAREIVAAAPGPLAVGVFVDAPPESVAATAREAALDAVQLHGDESPADVARLRDLLPNTLIFKAFRPRAAAGLARVGDLACDAVLVDAYDAAQHGGTGKRADWTLAASIRGPRVILAGGLGAENAAAAIAAVRPWALDLSSSVETAPGVKCPAKLAQLFDALRREAA